MPDRRTTGGGRFIDRTPEDPPWRKGITSEFGDTRGQQNVLQQIGSAISSVFSSGAKPGGEHFAFRDDHGDVMEFQYKGGKWYEFRQGGILGGTGWFPLRNEGDRRNLEQHLRRRREEQRERESLLAQERREIEQRVRAQE